MEDFYLIGGGHKFSEFACFLQYRRADKIQANAQADLNLRWAHMYEGTLSGVVVYMMHNAIKGPYAIYGLRSAISAFSQPDHSLSLRKHAYSNTVRILPPKYENFQMKNSDIFLISAQNIDCRYSLEPRR